MQSEQINELAAALSKAQSQIVGALKDSKNPFFKSNYADLASCWDACRKQLSDNGLAVIQTTDFDPSGIVFVITRLTHSSGQWIEGRLPVKAKDDGPQAQGSGITYARRYALAAIVGLAQIDDDAEAATGRQNTHNDVKGDLGKNVPKDVAQKLSIRMRECLEADTEEDRKAMGVADLHDQIKVNADEYTAAADLLTSKERSAWKAYLKFAHEAVKSEPTRANGRAA